MSRPTIPPPSTGFDYYEPAVQLAVKDFLRQGDLMLDVGANIGGIAAVASRIVGSSGQVVALEPSLRVLPELLANVQSWGARNVIYDVRAAWSKSDEEIGFYHGWSHVADSAVIKSGKDKPDHVVTTVSLDDLVAERGRAPSVVKLDIEGAEAEALKGFEKTINDVPPVLIIEMNIGDVALVNWLNEHGYVLFDTGDYQPFAPDKSVSYLVNVLAIPKRSTRLLSGMQGLRMVPVKTFVAGHWIADDESPCLPLGVLEAGRHVLRLSPNTPLAHGAEDIELVIGATDPYRMMTLHIAPWQQLAHGVHAHPFHMDSRRNAFLRIKRRSLDQVREMIGKIDLYHLQPTARRLPWRRDRLIG